MRVEYRCSEKISFTFDAETQKQAFGQLARLDEIFGGEHKCGCCGSVDIRFNVRKHQEFAFFELRCRACTAALSYGQKKEGGELWPKVNDNEGRPLDNGGWSVYEGTTQAGDNWNQPSQQGQAADGFQQPPAQQYGNNPQPAGQPAQQQQPPQQQPARQWGNNPPAGGQSQPPPDDIPFSCSRE